MTPTRRTMLAGGLLAGSGALGAACVQADVLPGRVAAWTAAGGLLPDAAPSGRSGPLDRVALRSRYRPGVTGVLVSTPPGTDLAAPAGLPVAVVLHGRGGSAASAEGLRVPGFLADTVAAGTPRFAAVAVDGGEAYWHPRADGTDPLRTITDEVLPLLADKGYATGPGDRVAVLGWSMGGYGALLLGQTLGRDRCAAVAALSPALWTRFADARPGAFDDAADFARHDVFAGRDRLAGVAVRVDCSLGEVFLPAARAFADGLAPHPAGGFGPGLHDERYWRRRMPDALAFAGRALAAAPNG